MRQTAPTPTLLHLHVPDGRLRHLLVGVDGHGLGAELLRQLLHRQQIGHDRQQQHADGDVQHGQQLQQDLVCDVTGTGDVLSDSTRKDTSTNIYYFLFFLFWIS